MKIVVFGSNGKVGRHVVDLAAADGHQVRALVHSSNPFKDRPEIEVIEGDVFDQKSVDAAVRDCDGVISALGSWGTAKKNIVSSGMERIIPAMKKAGVKRIVTVTGSAAYSPEDSPSIFFKVSHFFGSLFLPKILKDGEKHIQLLAKSTLGWTAIRSPLMINYGSITYKLSDKPALILPVHRKAVAQALLDTVTSQKHAKTSPFMHRV